MSRYGSSRRRNQNRAAMMIVIVSALCMCALMVLFFTAAWKHEQEPPQPEAPSGNVSDVGENPAGTTAEQTEQKTPPAAEVDPETQPPEQTQPIETEPSRPQVTPDTIPTFYDDTMLAEVALPEGAAPDGYADKLVFYGDSTTYGMKAYKVFGSRDTTQVWTPSSGTLALFRAATDLVYDPNSKTEMSLADICKTVKPEYLIMTLGVNGVSQMNESWFKTDYQTVIDIILDNSPDTKLILQSIYPVARSYENQESINNTKIQNANQWIVQIAKANNLPYLNTYSALVGDDGYLPESYQNGDGMHFNEVGFAAVMDYVKTHPMTE